MPSAARLGDLIGHVAPLPTDAKGEGGPSGVPTGLIVNPCSGDVFINGRPAARASVDPAVCALHPPLPLPIATGSSNVFINGQPAARRGDLIKCGAVIIGGSGNVFVGGGPAGGGTVQTKLIMPDDEAAQAMLQSLQMADVGAASLMCNGNEATDIAELDPRSSQSQLFPISAVEAFFTFNPAGVLMKSWANSAAGTVSMPFNATSGLWNLAVDTYGYGKQALFGSKIGVMGDERPYQPQSGIISAFKVNGVEETLGRALHSTVMGATGLTFVQAVFDRDPEAIGQAGPGVVLAVAGGAIVSRARNAYGGGSSAAKIAFETRGLNPEGLDPHLLRNFGNLLTENSVANAALRQMQRMQGKSGGQAFLHFADGPPGLAGRVAAGTGRAPTLDVFMNNSENLSARGAVGTYVHETSHFSRATRGFEIGTQLDEYMALRREFLYDYGRRPNILEKQKLWLEKIENDPFYSNRPVGGALPNILRKTRK